MSAGSAALALPAVNEAPPPMQRLRIAVATAGRFHVLDLARELQRLGHDVKFYSYVPRRRARRFGLPGECHVGLLAFALPALLWERLAPKVLPRLRERLLYALLDRAVVLRLQPCDVFVCMSGIYLEAARYAKRRYGARIWLERGSQHIQAQDEILAAVPGAQRPSRLAMRRELAGYALADRIVVPAAHVAGSFRRDPASHAKLFYNPYGVDLAMFPPRMRQRVVPPLSLVFVGTWSLRKGCDILADAVRRVSGARLFHIGSLGDLGFPADNPLFVHVDPVPQSRLAVFYAASDLLVLASREEGLSSVLAQALASGLPVVCTDRTGGADLAHTPALASRITIVPAGEADTLAAAITAWRDRLFAGKLPPPLAAADRERLSWAAHARRHSDELLRDAAGLQPHREKISA